MKVRTNFYICKPGLVFHQLFHFSFVYLVVENKIKIPNLGEPSCPFKISGPGVEYRRIRLEDGQEHHGARVQLNNAQDLQIAFHLIGSKFSGNLFQKNLLGKKKWLASSTNRNVKLLIITSYHIILFYYNYQLTMSEISSRSRFSREVELLVRNEK